MASREGTPDPAYKKGEDKMKVTLLTKEDVELVNELTP